VHAALSAKEVDPVAANEVAAVAEEVDPPERVYLPLLPARTP